MSQSESVELQIVLFGTIVELGSGYGKAWARGRRSAASSGVVVMNMDSTCLVQSCAGVDMVELVQGKFVVLTEPTFLSAIAIVLGDRSGDLGQYKSIFKPFESIEVNQDKEWVRLMGYRAVQAVRVCNKCRKFG